MPSRATQLERRSPPPSLLLGERSLRAYLAGGNVRFLKEAEASFSALSTADPCYRNAQFLLGVTKTQLRETKESIRIFESLRDSGGNGLSDQISLQLAYAHIKSYTQPDYDSAERELEKLMGKAAESHDNGLALQTMALQAFLYSVLSGRAADPSQRPYYVEKALKVGTDLLARTERDAESTRALRFEALNALGITWWRRGQLVAPEDRTGSWASWAKAQDYYERALLIIPNSLRVLQNLAQLRLSQVAFAPENQKAMLLEQAKQYCERSLEVSDQDQFPYYLLAQIAVRQGNSQAAREYMSTGLSRSGAVKPKDWEKVENDIRALESERGFSSSASSY